MGEGGTLRLSIPAWIDAVFLLSINSQMQDPKLNEITPQFGADVEKVAQIGPPREPRILDDRGVEIGIVGEKPVGDGDLI